jgi:hypothetical protein
MHLRRITIQETDNEGYIVEYSGSVSLTFVFDMLYVALQKVAELMEDRDSYYKCRIEPVHTPEEGE